MCNLTIRRAVVIPIVLIVSLAACRAKEGEKFMAGAEKSATDTAMHPASPGGRLVVPDVASGATVIVTLEDGRIVVANPDQIPPGPTIFTVTNGGKQLHNLFVEGEGISRGPAEESIPPGTTASFDVRLKVGRYTLYCPILDHREKGETLTLIITPPAAPAPTSTTIPGSPTTT